MKKLFKKFEDIMVAVTFAEAGEYDSAQKFLNEEVRTIEEEPVEIAVETA